LPGLKNKLRLKNEPQRRKDAKSSIKIFLFLAPWRLSGEKKKIKVNPKTRFPEVW
jgi:hypothetical protein